MFPIGGTATIAALLCGINALLSVLRKGQLEFYVECCSESFATAAPPSCEGHPTCGAALGISCCLLISGQCECCSFADRLLMRISTMLARSASVRFLRIRMVPNHGVGRRALANHSVRSRARCRPLNQSLRPAVAPASRRGGSRGGGRGRLRRCGLSIMLGQSVTSKHQT